MTKKVIKTFSNETKQIYDVNFTNEISTFNEILKKIDEIGELPVSRKSTQDYLTVLETQKNHIASVYANIFQGITDSANSLSKVYDDVKTASNGITNLNGCLKGDSTVQSFTLNKREYLSTKILDPNQLDAVTKFKFAKLGFTNKQLNNLQTLGYDLSSLYGEIMSTDSKNKKKYNKQDIKQMQSLADEDYDKAFTMDPKKCSKAMKIFIANYTLKVFQYDKKQCELDSNGNIKLTKTEKLMQSLVLEEPHENPIASASDYTNSNKFKYLVTISASLDYLLELSNRALYSGNVKEENAKKVVKEADEMVSLLSLTQGLVYSIVEDKDNLNKSGYNNADAKLGMKINNLAYDQDQRASKYDMNYVMGHYTPLNGKTVYEDYSEPYYTDNGFRNFTTKLVTSDTEKSGMEYKETMQTIKEERESLVDNTFKEILVGASSYIPYVGSIISALAPDADADIYDSAEDISEVYDDFAKTKTSKKTKSVGKIIKALDVAVNAGDKFKQREKLQKKKTFLDFFGSVYQLEIGTEEAHATYKSGFDDPATNYVLGKINKNGIRGLMEEHFNECTDKNEKTMYDEHLHTKMADYEKITVAKRRPKENEENFEGRKKLLNESKKLWFGKNYPKDPKGENKDYPKGGNNDFDILKMDPNDFTNSLKFNFQPKNAADDEIKHLIKDEIQKYREKETS